jgi:hypothetical protein
MYAVNIVGSVTFAETQLIASLIGQLQPAYPPDITITHINTRLDHLSKEIFYY